LKLLLDQLYSNKAALTLTASGYEVLSATDLPELKGKNDELIFAWAKETGRALVTNNHRHFVSLHRQCLADGQHHYGLILTSDRSLPRHLKAIGPFTRALAALLDQHVREDALMDAVYWLSPLP